MFLSSSLIPLTSSTLREKIIKTPITECVGYKLANRVCIVPILRAGLGMVDSLKSLIPTASIGHIGLYRDEKTLMPISYFEKALLVNPGLPEAYQNLAYAYRQIGNEEKCIEYQHKFLLLKGNE